MMLLCSMSCTCPPWSFFSLQRNPIHIWTEFRQDEIASSGDEYPIFEGGSRVIRGRSMVFVCVRLLGGRRHLVAADVIPTYSTDFVCVRLLGGRRRLVARVLVPLHAPEV